MGHLMTADIEPFINDEGYKISAHINMDITSYSDKTVSEQPTLVCEEIANIFALLVLIPYNSLIYALNKYDTLNEVAIFLA